MSPLTNYTKTLSELKNFISMPIENDRDRAGIIQAFEFTFEQSWKAIQKVASNQGVEIANPKSAFGYAMQNRWISQDNEKVWLELLKDRNLTTHTYNQSLAKEILKRIQDNYLSLFENLLSHLEKQI